MKTQLYAVLVVLLTTICTTALADARLYATVKPSSAQVYILNITPAFRQGMSLKAGTYEILVAKRGYKGVRKKIQVGKRDVHLTAVLVKDDSTQASTLSIGQRYALRVNIQPKGARIRIMNINPRFQQGMLLKPGRYDVMATKSGYNPKRQWVRINNRDVTLNWRLSKAQQASASTTQPTPSKSALAQQAQPSLLPDTLQVLCFAHTDTYQQANHSVTSEYQARLEQYPDFVKVDFVSNTQGLRNLFNFSGVALGDEFKLAGVVSYDDIRQAVNARMLLEDNSLQVNIEQDDGLLLEHVLQKVACSEVDI